MKSVYLLAIYPKLQSAEQTLSRLIEAGYSPNQMGVVVSSIYSQAARHSISDGTNREISIYATLFQQVTHHWAQNSRYYVAGIGSLVATGVFETIIGTDDRFQACFDSIGIPTPNSELILESLRQGDVLLGIQTSPHAIERVSEFLCLCDPVDSECRARDWRKRGWRGFDAMSDPYSVEEIIRKKRQYTPPQAESLEDCIERVVLCYFTQTDEEA